MDGSYLFQHLLCKEMCIDFQVNSRECDVEVGANGLFVILLTFFINILSA